MTPVDPGETGYEELRRFDFHERQRKPMTDRADSSLQPLSATPESLTAFRTTLKEFRELAHQCGEAYVEGSSEEAREAVKVCEAKEAEMVAHVEALASSVTALEARVAERDEEIARLAGELDLANTRAVEQATGLQHITDGLRSRVSALEADGRRLRGELEAADQHVTILRRHLAALEPHDANSHPTPPETVP
jgi:chromosome segregation ATPase